MKFKLSFTAVEISKGYKCYFQHAPCKPVLYHNSTKGGFKLGSLWSYVVLPPFFFGRLSDFERSKFLLSSSTTEHRNTSKEWYKTTSCSIYLWQSRSLWELPILDMVIRFVFSTFINKFTKLQRYPYRSVSRNNIVET